MSILSGCGDPSHVRIIENGNYYKHYRCDGRTHRDDGPAIIYRNGNAIWYNHNNITRLDGPAIIYADGTEFWVLNGKWHRLDGPAKIFPNGDGQYFVNNVNYDKTTFERVARAYCLK